MVQVHIAAVMIIVDTAMDIAIVLSGVAGGFDLLVESQRGSFRHIRAYDFDCTSPATWTNSAAMSEQQTL